MSIEVLASYTWPTDAVPLAGLGIRVDDLAARLGLPVHTWDVEGLGPARGFGGRLPSGVLVLLEELQLAVRYQGARGPTVYVDAADLGAIGPDMLVGELLAALGLSRSDLVGIAGEAEQRRAAEMAAQVRQAQAARVAPACGEHGASAAIATGETDPKGRRNG
jgi:hypothetical protein